jgi:hypothetical protein
VQALVQQLGSSHVPELQAAESALALAQLVHCSAAGAAAVLEAGAVPALVQLLRPQQPARGFALRCQAAAALTQLLAHERTRLQAAADSTAAGAIPPLQQLLLGAMPGSRGAGSTQEERVEAACHAATCLHNIALTSQGAAAAREAGAHRFMVRLLGARSPKLKDMALAFLALPTGGQQGAAAAVAAGALEQAARLLRSPYFCTQRLAAGVLSYILGACPAEAQAPLGRHLRHAPRLLLELVAESGSLRVRLGAGKALLSPITADDAAVAWCIMGSTRAVVSISMLLCFPGADSRWGSWYGRCLAAAVEYRGARGAAADIATFGAQTLVQMLREAAAAVQQPGSSEEGAERMAVALRALRALAARRDPGTSRQLLEAGALQALRQLPQPQPSSGSSGASAALVGGLVLVPAAFAPLLVARRIMTRARAAARIGALLLEAARGAGEAGAGQEGQEVPGAGLAGQPGAGGGRPAADAAAGPGASGSPWQQAPRCCARCGKRAARGQRLRLCGGCRRVHYCGSDCQRAHWPDHWRACVDAQRQQGQGGSGSG